MFERFTGAARQAVTEAQDEARALADVRIEPAHLWLSLLRHESMASKVLGDVGVDAEAVRKAIDQIRLLRRRAGIDEADTEALRAIGIDVDEVIRSVEENVGLTPPRRRSGHIVFGREAKRVLEQALRSALDMHHNYVGTEHLLLGLHKVAPISEWNLDYLELRRYALARTSKAG